MPGMHTRAAVSPAHQADRIGRGAILAASRLSRLPLDRDSESAAAEPLASPCDGREVDIIRERRDGTVVCIEVKSAASASPSDYRGLRHLRDRLGDRFKAGVLLYTGPNTVPFGDHLAAVPLSGLWGDPAPERRVRLPRQGLV